MRWLYNRLRYELMHWKWAHDDYSKDLEERMGIGAIIFRVFCLTYCAWYLLKGRH